MSRLKINRPFLRVSALSFVAVICLLSLAPRPAQAWGAAGHAIVATIAQSLLHPAVRTHLCTILPEFTQYTSTYPREGAPHTHCHLAPLASWPDTAKWRMPWSGRYHYVNPIDDDPPQSCTYGEFGWTSEENVLTSMVNYTRQLRDASGQQRDEALRFVTHLVGDAHQPLHLTGRQRGGNDVHVRFEGRAARLHSVWDSQILNVQMRNLANYTTPLRSPQIESALRGQVYDAYTRWIMAEGLGIALDKLPTPPAAKGWWEDEWQAWSLCPEHSSGGSDSSPTDGVDKTDLPVCPMAWTRPMHPLVCQYAFASPVPQPVGKDDLLNGSSDEAGQPSAMRRRRRRRRRPTPPSPVPPGRGGGGGQDDLPELAVPEYLGRIDSDKVMQQQLAKAGVRLAAILNSVLLDEALAHGTASESDASTGDRLLEATWGRLRRMIRGQLAVWGF
ncbi:unnamed protein product [Parajaminaea phylloscopi]